jgi:hypothetical protein
MSTSNDLSSEEENTDTVRSQGISDGLFRSCMDEIKAQHTTGQSLRNAFIAAGLLTEVKSYAEMLVQFYSATFALSQRLKQIRKTDGDYMLIKKLLSRLQYDFVKGYEADLEFLLKSEWRGKAEQYMTVAAKKYEQRLTNANECELIAGIFILWGPLIIGGGPALKFKVEKAFGKEATNIFHDVVGAGRGERKTKFIKAYDELLDVCDDLLTDTKKKDIFDDIVKYSGEFMKLNNDMMSSVKESPGFLKRVRASFSLVVGGIFSMVYNRAQTSITNLFRGISFKFLQIT